MQAKQLCYEISLTAKGGPTGMLALAGSKLNQVLNDLMLNKDLKVNRVTQLLTVQAGAYGPFALEADYLRTYDLFYQIPTAGGATASTQTIFLIPITMEQFDAEFKTPATSNYPYEFATDLSTQAQVWSGGAQGDGVLLSAGNVFVYPQSSGQIVMTHRYMRRQPDIVNPQTSLLEPWFPYDQYLVTAASALLMEITGDNRTMEFRDRAEAMLKPHLIMEGDEQKAVHNIKLDPRHFRFGRGLKPTKAMPI